MDKPIDEEAITDGNMADCGSLAEQPEATPASVAMTDLTPRREATPPDEVFLAATAREIRRHCQLLHCEKLEIGRLLLEVRKRVAHGQWARWLQREFRWSESLALKIMQMYEAFGSNPERVTRLKLATSSLYLMAAPHTRAEARDEVMRRAEAGEEVSRTEVKRIIQEAKANLNPKERRRVPPGPPVHRKRPMRTVDDENLWISWGRGAQVRRRWKNSVSLLTWGDAGSLFATLRSAIRAADDGAECWQPWSCWVGSIKRFATTPRKKRRTQVRYRDDVIWSLCRDGELPRGQF